MFPPSRLLSKRRKKNYWGFGVNCTGNEADVSECKLGREVELKGNRTCEQGMPVVISCIPGRAFAPSISIGYMKAYRVEVHSTLHSLWILSITSWRSELLLLL